jgi:acyl-CoA reductase-like NAD-dependent aldehyde dehydrogenase
MVCVVEECSRQWCTPADSVDAANPDDIKHTIVDAHAAFESGVWSRAPALHRSKVLTRLARALEERVPALAELETLQTGRAIREMRAQLARLPEWL